MNAGNDERFIEENDGSLFRCEEKIKEKVNVSNGFLNTL